MQRYGGDLFHARFMTLGNLRGILHRGVGAYLDYLQENHDPLHPLRLLDDLDSAMRRDEAVRRLELVLQAVVENYEEYKDYNTTTTQSDYGENLHVLLDFLRLKAQYDRHAWQFRPLVLAHEVLARHGRPSTALRWEESLVQFSASWPGSTSNSSPGWSAATACASARSATGSASASSSRWPWTGCAP